MPIYSDKDPIVAIATASGRGGVGIVRLSADDRFIEGFIKDFFGPSEHFKARYAHYRPFKDRNGNQIDEGLALYFPAPKSYTGESVLELQAHGGPVILKLLLQEILRVGKSKGLRLAEPGEFTKRAFLNGRIDLSQAEAVADLIDATTEGAARAASRSLSGAFSSCIHKVGDKVIELRALIEAILDFPEEEIDFIQSTQARERLLSITKEFEELMHQSQQGSILREGVTVVLVGSPNVGKSSLMNQLSGSDVALVTDVAGTTRDKIESLGIERTLQAVEGADIVLHLIDATNENSDEEGQKILKQVMQRVSAGVPVLQVFNKCDLNDEINWKGEWIGISAKTGEGIPELKQKLLTLVGWENKPESTFLARERHLEALKDAYEHLKLANQFVNLENPPLDLLAEELRLCNESLGFILGETTPDDLLGMIFSRFCIGK